MFISNPVKLTFHRSNRHFYAQLLLVNNGNVIASASTLEADIFKLDSNNNIKTSNVNGAKKVAQLLSSRAKIVGIKSIQYTDLKYRYRGKVKIFLDTLRNEGTSFSRSISH